MASPLPGLTLLLTPTPISPETRAAFAAYQWCTDLLNSTLYTPVQTIHQNPHSGTNINFMTKALGRPEVLRASQSFYEPATAEPRPLSESLGGVLHTLYLLGEHASGSPGISHGGLIATLLDQQAGSLVVSDPTMTLPRTVFCHIKYRRTVKVPGPVRVRAWKGRVEGRKHFVEAELIDGQGKVLASAETLFVNAEGRL